jgi:hypothetical protein
VGFGGGARTDGRGGAADREPRRSGLNDLPLTDGSELMGGNSSHGGGRSYRGRLEEWEAFDVLPGQVRKALNYAAFSWSSAAILRHLCKGDFTPSEVVFGIERADQRRIERDKFKVWGIRPTLEDLGL